MIDDTLSPAILAIDIGCADWETALPDAEAIVSRAIEAALTAAVPGLDAAEISVILIDDAEQQNLNRQWRDRDSSTNVLSFPGQPIAAGSMPEPEFPGVPLSLGDLSLAFGTVRDEAAAQNKTLGDHVSHLVVHGTLHLLGYDHEQEDAAEIMEAFEIRILAGLGIADPYGKEHDR